MKKGCDYSEQWANHSETPNSQHSVVRHCQWAVKIQTVCLHRDTESRWAEDVHSDTEHNWDCH